MRTIAFLTQKGGAGKTTLAASLAVAAAGAGERVIALDLDPQGSLARWGERREAAKAAEPGDGRAARIRASAAAPHHPRRTGRSRLYDRGLRHRRRRQRGRPVHHRAADLCLLPARPARLDVEATAATFRAVFLAKRKAAFVLNQCPSTYRSSRVSESAREPDAARGAGRADAVRAHGFSRRDRCRPRCDRIRAARPRSTGDRRTLELDPRPVQRNEK